MIYQTPYDFFSTMHYPETFGCSNGKVCMVVKEPYRTFFKDRSLLKSYPVSKFLTINYSISRVCPLLNMTSGLESKLFYPVKNYETNIIQGGMR